MWLSKLKGTSLFPVEVTTHTRKHQHSRKETEERTYFQENLKNNYPASFIATLNMQSEKTILDFLSAYLTTLLNMGLLKLN